MNAALAGRRCGGEGRSGGRRREYDQMWAYGRTSVQEKQICMLKERKLNVWEKKSEGTERKDGEIFFYLSKAQEVLLQSGSISFSLAFICITFWLCGGYILHTKIQTWAHILHMCTQKNKIQSWLFASCPTENNHRQIHFANGIIVYCMCPPSEYGSLLWDIFSSAYGDLQSPPASLFYNLPPMSYLINHHHTWIQKEDNTMSICGFDSMYIIQWKYCLLLICISPFHPHILIFLFVLFVSGWCLFS